MEVTPELQTLIQQASEVQTTYTNSLINYMQIQVGRLDVPLQERQEIIGLFARGVNELAEKMFESGIIIGCAASELGIGPQIVNLVINGGQGE